MIIAGTVVGEMEVGDDLGQGLGIGEGGAGLGLGIGGEIGLGRGIGGIEGRPTREQDIE